MDYHKITLQQLTPKIVTLQYLVFVPRSRSLKGFFEPSYGAENFEIFFSIQ